MYTLLRKLLFKINAETSHELTLDMLGAAKRLGLLSFFAPKVADQPVEVLGLTFKNPVGLAAGLDKNGDYIDALGSLGFGFIEIGTITPRPQAGNPKPRLFRLPEHQAIINRMGFNNKGVDHLVEQVKKSNYTGVLGINIGKNFDTSVEDANQDYLICLEKVYEYADYITVNISSPNTPGLRTLQFGESLTSLLSELKQAQLKLEKQHGQYTPILVKIAPDMNEEETQMVAKTLIETQMDGVIATNTTLERDAVAGHKFAAEAGGLSGLPVQDGSLQVLKWLAQALNGSMPIIGVGGIVDGESAADKIKAGAELVQVYSGFIYEGPKLISQANDAIAAVKN
ncbi:quinone-dependent dihydroorotate dehydrogenase [Oceaniserpentilla sp. 4NH20-0058]|uniref:quinone-dependent dihydroorotate dehydrogenase n=1 Tax=Oceaniserpentilla sp. 4NH20-0058 TaxID=3127660 RepID=UPI003104D025